MEKDLSLAGEFTKLHNKYRLDSKQNHVLDKEMDWFCVSDILSRGNLWVNDKDKF